MCLKQNSVANHFYLKGSLNSQAVYDILLSPNCHSGFLMSILRQHSAHCLWFSENKTRQAIKMLQWAIKWQSRLLLMKIIYIHTSSCNRGHFYKILAISMTSKSHRSIYNRILRRSTLNVLSAQMAWDRCSASLYTRYYWYQIHWLRTYQSSH